MKNKKIIITLSIIAILVLTIGITYSIFTSSKTSKNSNLIAGDIYMHYNETNQIQMENATPTNPYVVNPIMATQEYTKGGTNELSKCVDAFVNIGAPENVALSMCKEDSSTIIGILENGKLDEFNLTDTFIKENILTINSSIPYFEFTVDGKNTTTNKDIWYEVVLSKGDNIDGKTRIKDNLLKFRLTETKDNKETIVVDNKSYSDLTSKRIWVDTINKNTINEVVHTYRLYMWISNDTVIGNVNQDYTMEEWKNIFASIKVGVSGDFNEKYIIPETSCFTTEENATGLTITDYDSSCGSKMVIPATIDDKKITKIGSNSFLNKNLLSVSIPSNITIIDDNAFTNNQLTSVEIPSNVTTIGSGAFANNQLTNVKIPSSVTTIGGASFANNQLTNIEIPSSVTTIESGTFYNNKISNVNINASITSIGAYAFTNNNIQDLIVPDTVTKLHCKSFDDGVVNNRDMTCQETDASCFTTKEVKSYQLNNNMTEEELNKCINYMSKRFSRYNEETLESYCKGTGTLDGKPFKVKLKDQYSFSGETLEYLETNNIITFTGTDVVITDYDSSCGSDVVIPKVINEKEVAIIGGFKGKQLKSVIIPDSAAIIKNYAFDSNQLSHIEIPNSVIGIYTRAFYFNNISSVAIPNTVAYLECQAFDPKVSIKKSNNLRCVKPMK